MSESPSVGMSDHDIRREGWRALTERLGVAGAVRFLLQYDPGRGDYVRERRELFRGWTLDEATRRIEERERRLPEEGP